MSCGVTLLEVKLVELKIFWILSSATFSPGDADSLAGKIEILMSEKEDKKRFTESIS